MASCLRGAFPPVDLRAVCFVRAMSTNNFEMIDKFAELALKEIIPGGFHSDWLKDILSDWSIKSVAILNKLLHCYRSGFRFQLSLGLLKFFFFAQENSKWNGTYSVRIWRLDCTGLHKQTAPLGATKSFESHDQQK